MTIDTLHEKFVYHLEKMYYIENQLVDVLEGMRGDIANDDLRETIDRHRQQTKEQAGRLEEIFDIIDEPPEERPSPTFDALLEEREQFLEVAGNDADMRDLHDLGATVKTEHLEIAGYENLIALARKLEMNQDVRHLLDQNLDEEQQSKKQLKAMADDSTIRKAFARLAG